MPSAPAGQHDVGEVHQAAVGEESGEPSGPREKLRQEGQHRPDSPLSIALMPFRMSRSRKPATGVSMVTTSAE